MKSTLVRAKNAVRWIFTPRIHTAVITMTTMNQRAQLSLFRPVQPLDSSVQHLERTICIGTTIRSFLGNKTREKDVNQVIIIES